MTPVFKQYHIWYSSRHTLKLILKYKKRLLHYFVKAFFVLK